MVGGIPTPLKNMSSSIGMVIPDIWKINKNTNHHPNLNWTFSGRKLIELV